ncbi:MAG: restriction endonuclease subunit M, partial [Actinomycetota bacterium]|nr:restriction endonuclease subunit M [Actinomycetota bacterium]
MESSHLFYGDNLDVLRESVAANSVDLVYLDPPFNSNRSYNVIFDRASATSDFTAQMQAFDDTWHWTDATETQYEQAIRSYLPPTAA